MEVNKLSSKEQHVLPLIINGEEVSSLDNRFSVPSPHQGAEALCWVHGASLDDAVNACEAAGESFTEWRNTPHTKRLAILAKAADILEGRSEKFYDMLEQHGLPRWFAELNVNQSIDALRKAGTNWKSTVHAEPGGGHDFEAITYEPIGPVLTMAPWNAPLVLAMRGLAAPLAAGCSVVLKTSEYACDVQLEAARCLIDAGIPRGVVNVVHCSTAHAPEIVKALIIHRAIKKVNFTGSTAVGKIVAKLAAENLKPVLLELGGKCSVLIDKDANLAKAATAVLLGAWSHMGQICMSTERVFVHESVYSNFVKYLRELAPSFLQNKEFLMPLRAAHFASKVLKLVDDAKQKGAEVIYESEMKILPHPMILGSVTPDMDIFEIESFGPVFFVSSVKSMDEAVKIVNSSDYGLSNSVWSTNTTNAVRIAKQIESGAVHINGMTVHDAAHLPHGGVKHSGFGRFNSIWGIREFQQPKVITISGAVDERQLSLEGLTLND